MMKSFCIFLLTFVVQYSLIAQTLTSVILPQYIQGNTGTNSNRIPYVCRLRITGLQVNTAYRYINQVVRSTDAATTNGAGNCIFHTTTGNFFRTSGPDLSTTGDYGTLITDGAGSYEGWFVTEPTGNARFLPGAYIFIRIMLNDGSTGTTAATRLTTTDSARVIKLDPTYTDSTGTGLRCSASVTSKDFIFLYSTTAGTGRPISGSFVESEGTDNSIANNYAAFYSNSVNGVEGSFGVVLPNILPDGVRHVEQRARSTGSVVVSASDENGIWPSGVNTMNPLGGISELVLAGTDLQWISDVESSSVNPREYMLFQNYPNPFNPYTTILYAVPTRSKIRLLIYNAVGQVVADLINTEQSEGWNSIVWNAHVSSGLYFYRMEAVSTENPSKRFVETKKMILLK
jgi:hypothetical protein